MATKRAYVYKVPGLIDGYKVFPPVIVLDQSDKFELVNTVDDHDAFLTIPDGPFTGGAVKGEKIGPKSKSTAKQPKAGTFGVEYEVKVDGKKASGNSDPVIIIDPS
jgi:hypothetical protein